MNALVEILGKQFKVEKGDKIKVPFIDKKIEKFFKSNYIKNKGVNAWLCLPTVQK